VSVTVTEVDLPRKRIALSMRSRPEIGPKSGGVGGSAPSARTGPGKPVNRNADSVPAPRPAQSLAGDWFSAAIKKKH
jgi:uncharacterized protein